MLSQIKVHPMDDKEFQQFRDLIYNHSGISFTEDSKYLLENRLDKRLSTLNLSGYRDYYHYIKYGPKRDQEMMEVMNLLTTNETYFFRESFQLKAFTDEIIPEVVKNRDTQNGRTLRIWSAGCSSGEEPYSIAMLILEHPLLHGWNVEIIGTDISQRVLQQARHGVYSKSAFRSTDDYYIKRYFTEQPDGYRINDQVRQLVTISHLNMYDTDRIILLGRMDLIFCRNVIIYFDNSARKKVVSAFHGALRDGGFLLLGHSESLMNISTQFLLRHFRNDMIYQKPDRVIWGGAG
jgi:chemotaxis protein methyltransferase CheR